MFKTLFNLIGYRKSKSHETKSGFEILEIQIPKSIDDDHSEIQSAPLAAEQLFASIHGLLRADKSLQESFSFEMFSSQKGIRFYAAVPSNVREFVESQIYAQYPTSHITVVPDYVNDVNEGLNCDGANLVLSKRYIFPIKTFKDFEVDPLSAITSVLAGVTENEQIWFQLLIKPTPDVWQGEGYDYVTMIRTGVAPSKSFLFDIPKAIFKELLGVFSDIVPNVLNPARNLQGGLPAPQFGKTSVSAGQDLSLKAIENKLSKMGFEVVIRILSFSQSTERASSNLRALVASMRQFSTSDLNSFTLNTARNKKDILDSYRKRELDDELSFILNIEEMASIFHLPSASVETPNIDWVFSKKSEPPANLPTEDCVLLGETTYRNQKIRFGLKNGDDRLRHMYLIGKTGTGKSSMFESMIAQDIKNGFGVGVLDPHGELIENVLEYIPDERINDVILFDPSDTARPVGFNMLEMEDSSQKNLMASGLVSAIKQHFDYSWGPRLEYLLNYSILTLLEVEGTTMLGITRLLEDENYQKYILHKVKDPVIIDFWEKEYKNMKGNQRLITEAVAPIQNKVNRFLSSTTIRNILGQRKSTVNLWDAMNSKKIILINLSKGKIGDDNANLLGALLVSRIQFTALQRVKIPSNDRVPFYLYVDEFQNFVTGTFESILSESRKYKLGMYLTHQFTAQLPEELLDAVFGNVGTIAAFSVGAPDAKVLTQEFTPFFEETDLISLERFHIYMKLMIDGMTSLPFSAKILVPWDPESRVVKKTTNKERVIALSREKYGVDSTYIEDKIRKWVEFKFDKGKAIAEENRDKEAQTADSPSTPDLSTPDLK